METVQKQERSLQQTAGGAAHGLFLAHGLAVGTRASDVEERLLLGGGEGRGRGAHVTPSGGGKRRGGGGLTPPTGEAFYAGRGADSPGALAWEGKGKSGKQKTTRTNINYAHKGQQKRYANMYFHNSIIRLSMDKHFWPWISISTQGPLLMKTIRCG